MKTKRLINLLFTILLVLLVGSMFWACKKDDIHNLKVKYEAVELPINGVLYIGNYITYDGKGALTYSVENTDVLQLQDDKVTGIGVGVGKVIVDTHSETVRFDVYVVDPYQVDIEAIDMSHEYDGTAKNIKVKADLPPDGVLKYFVDGKEFFGTSEPGVYQVSVLAVLPDSYNPNYINQTATLKVEKARISLDIRFSNATYEYDGNVKELLITGKLPSNVTVSYKNNKAVDAGVYYGQVDFHVDTKYYEEIYPLKAKLTITKAKLDYSSLGFNNKTVSYSGQKHCIAFDSMPDGFDVQYYQDAVEDENKISDITKGFTDVGSYKIIAVITAQERYNKNYAFANQVTATLHIKKADFINHLSWNDISTVYTYDGTAITVGIGGSVFLTGDKPVGVNGEFPDGVEFSYHYMVNGKLEAITDDNNTVADVGIYTVVAKFDMPDGYQKNYNKIDNMEYAFTIQKAQYNMDGVSFVGDTFTFDGSGRTFAVERPEAFDNNVSIKYTVKKDDEVIQDASDDPYNAKDAGQYIITASFTYNKGDLANNYFAIATKTITVQIDKLAVDLGDVTLSDAQYTYQNGTERSLKLTGELPNCVTASYSENNGQISAGEYEIKVNFNLVIDGNAVAEHNFYFTQNSATVDYYKTALLTIKKADFSADEVGKYKDLSGTYSPQTTLADYVIYKDNDEPALNITWENATLVPTVNNAMYVALYNHDKANYNDYEIIIKVVVDKADIDGQDIEIASQFLPRTGSVVQPNFTLKGQTAGMLTAIVTAEKPLVEWGEYPVEIAFALTDSDNYKFINAPEPISITVYIYNATQFEYTGTQLVQYKGGSHTVLTVPTGTTSIKNNAIANIAGITEIILPSTLVQTGMANGAINLSGAELTDITLPFVGVNNHNHFASLFGRENKNLPAYIERVTVTDQTTIYKDAFQDCKDLKSITYTISVQNVGENAFNGCSGLRSLTIGSQMTEIGPNAFRQCLNLTSLTLPFIGNNIDDTISTIAYLIGTNAGDNAYTNYMLSTLTISGDIKSLPDLAFAGLSRANVIGLPDTITKIGKKAFENVQATLNLNENITQITQEMFANYMGVKLVLPSTLTDIQAYAFDGATNLTSLTLPSSVTSIGEYAFKGVGCNVVFAQGATITEIGKNAFNGYKGSQFVIPQSVHTLGIYAFRNSSITSITVPSGIDHVGEGVFQDCASLQEVTLLNTVVSAYMFANCGELSAINFENTIRIENNAFTKCTSLQSVVLKAQVNFVGEHAFSECDNLNSCEIRANDVIGMCKNSFKQGLTIRVPNADAYESRYPETFQFLTWAS